MENPCSFESLGSASAGGKLPACYFPVSGTAIYLLVLGWVPPYVPYPPVYWNHRVSVKTRFNLWGSTTYGQNLGNKGVSPLLRGTKSDLHTASATMIGCWGWTGSDATIGLVEIFGGLFRRSPAPSASLRAWLLPREREGAGHQKDLAQPTGSYRWFATLARNSAGT